MEGVVELPDAEVLGASVLDCVNIKEAVCEGNEVSVLATTVDKELVEVNESVSVTETELENEFVGYSDVRGGVLVVMDGVEVDLVVVKAAMTVLLVTLGCSVLNVLESGVQF